jgi:hypothetical protein
MVIDMLLPVTDMSIELVDDAAEVKTTRARKGRWRRRFLTRAAMIARHIEGCQEEIERMMAV